MSLLTVVGVVLILIGILLLVWPPLLSVLVAIAALVGGAFLVYRGFTRATVR